MCVFYLGWYSWIGSIHFRIHRRMVRRWCLSPQRSWQIRSICRSIDLLSTKTRSNSAWSCRSRSVRVVFSFWLFFISNLFEFSNGGSKAALYSIVQNLFDRLLIDGQVAIENFATDICQQRQNALVSSVKHFSLSLSQYDRFLLFSYLETIHSSLRNCLQMAWIATSRRIRMYNAYGIDLI